MSQRLREEYEELSELIKRYQSSHPELCTAQRGALIFDVLLDLRDTANEIRDALYANPDLPFIKKS